MVNPKTIESKIVHKYKFNPIEKMKEEKEICIDEIVIKELHKFQDEAQLLFDKYIQEKQNIYDIHYV